MAAKAFVLIETTVGKTNEVASSLKQLKQFKSVDLVTGPYDVIAVLEGESLAEIGDWVTSKIHTITGVSRTIACLALSR